jgi:hypothetical protein
MNAEQLADWFEITSTSPNELKAAAAAMLRKQDSAIKMLREALYTMNEVFSDRDSGEVDRKLAIKDARIALSATEEFK